MIRSDDSPALFALEHLHLELYPWQVDALEAIGRGVLKGLPPTSLVAANGTGKTQWVIAPAILWFLWRYKKGLCPITSGSWMQIEKQLFPALHAFRGYPVCSGWTFNQTEIKTPTGGWAFGFSTDNPGRAEGHHPRGSIDDGPVFYVADEAKTIPDGIFDAIGRCTLRFQLLASSPGAPRGKFYRSHHEEASEHTCIKATSDDCAHISREKIDRDRRLYGDDHPVMRSMHYAEFTEDTDRLILDAPSLRRAIDAQPDPDTGGETVAFCDFAAGRDENVLAVRHGNKVRIIKAWREKDTVQACREFARLFQEHSLRAGQIWGDADGLGCVMIDQLAELRWRINRFHGGTPAQNPEEYANLIGEVWHIGAREIERGRINLGQLDPETFRQLTTRKSEWSDNGKLRAESKEKMAKAGMKSPDRGDTILGAIACGSRLTNAVGKREIEAAVYGNNAFAGDTVTDF